MNKISWWRTNFGKEEIERVTASIYNENISQGSVSEEFENRIAKALDIPYAVVTTSGTTALLMALMALDVRSGDEVIVPNRTWIATAHAPLMLGAKVILVDVKPDVPIMDVSLVEQKITNRTKAIIPVHLGGRSVDMEEIRKIADKHGLHIIEDAAQALFAANSMGYLGTQSDAGCFSLSVAKLISTGQGGFVVTKSKDVYQRLKLVRTHGVGDVIDVTYDARMGFNFRFTDLQASIGIEQLARAPKRLTYLKKIYAKYESELKKIPALKLIPVDVSHGEIPLYVEVLCKQRKNIINYLSSCGIQTRPFYPDLNLAPYLANGNDFPNSKVFGEQGLFLPCGPTQSLDNIEQVMEALRSYSEREYACQ